MAKSLDPGRILFEDNHLLVYNKPCGLLTQKDYTGDDSIIELAKVYIKEKYNKPGDVYVGLIHRIDRPTSGIIALAKTSKALSRMEELFRRRDVRKTYWALVHGKVEGSATLTHWLRKNAQRNKSYASEIELPDHKKAITHFRVLKNYDNYTALEVKIETGRHHQIRSQLSKIGYPIKGDLKYGAKRSNRDGGISLHARGIEFLHPVKKEPVQIVARPPGPDTMLSQLHDG